MQATRAMAAEIKEQVLAELNHPGYQAYNQLVEALRTEILGDLKKQRAYPELVQAIKEDVLTELSQTRKNAVYTNLGPQEREQIKQEVLRELQKEQGEQEYS